MVLGLRGNELMLSGEGSLVARAEEVTTELLHVLESRELTELELGRAAGRCA